MSFSSKTFLFALVLALSACGDSSTEAPAGAEVADEAPTVTEESGTLEAGDETLESGEFVDVYSVIAREGQWIRAELLSSDFDPYMIVLSPTGDQTDVDDSQEGNRSHTKSIVRASEPGAWKLAITTYEVGESGDYTLTYEVLDEKPEDALEGRQVTPSEEAEAEAAE